MKISKIICFTVGAMLAATAACADETLIVSNVLGPEGPLYVDGNLYYVGWVSNALPKWDGKTTTVLNHTPGCGHNGSALTKRKTFLLAESRECTSPACPLRIRLRRFHTSLARPMSQVSPNQ